jgi:hypothetical protein
MYAGMGRTSMNEDGKRRACIRDSIQNLGSHKVCLGSFITSPFIQLHHLPSLHHFTSSNSLIHSTLAHHVLVSPNCSCHPFFSKSFTDRLGLCPRSWSSSPLIRLTAPFDCPFKFQHGDSGKCEVQIIVDGTPAEEYDDDEEEEVTDNDKAVTKYVEAVAGAHFAVKFLLQPSYSFTQGQDSVTARVDIDGHFAKLACWTGTSF